MNRFALLAAALLHYQPLAAQPSMFRAEGPVPVTADSHPFGAATHTRTPSDLAADGYVEEEFLFSGQARVYDWPQAGTAVARTPAVPYTTLHRIRIGAI